jgi:hypothetical protein
VQLPEWNLEAPFSVVVGAPALDSQLPAGDVLLMDASSQRLEPLAADHEAGRTLVCEAVVLAEQADEPVVWHRYGDSRFDGVVPPERWQPWFPNLRVQGQETLAGQRLEVLLDRWAAAHGGPRPFQLWLRQGDRLAALAGLGSWLPHLQRVELVGPKAIELWQEPLSEWLKPWCFQPLADRPGCWERDLLADCRQERDALAALVREYEDRLAQITADVDQLLAVIGQETG